MSHFWGSQRVELTAVLTRCRMGTTHQTEIFSVFMMVVMHGIS